MKRRVMIVGPTGCGKTTLANILDGVQRPLRRTQDIIYGPRTIDTPGAYVENAWMYKYLITASQTASHVLVLVDQSRFADVYAPGFATPFTCPVVGVISKAELCLDNVERSCALLERIGVEKPYFSIDAHSGTGLRELKEYLFGKE